MREVWKMTYSSKDVLVIDQAATTETSTVDKKSNHPWESTCWSLTRSDDVIIYGVVTLAFGTAKVRSHRWNIEISICVGS